VRPRDRALIGRLDAGLGSYHQLVRPLRGIQSAATRQVFLEQMAESVHRVAYVRVVAQRPISPLRADPASSLFDPIKAAILHHRWGRVDEAFWLIFVFVHFGKHGRDGYRLARDIYGGLDSATPWNWEHTSADPRAFRRWLAGKQNRLKTDGVRRRFGNHRKYESLDGWSPAGTGEAVETYVRWVRLFGSHEELVGAARERSGDDPRQLFHELYRSMSAVARFGRTAKFDYLAMLGKLNLAPIEPGSTYMGGATGPLTGARLLFSGNAHAGLKAPELDGWLVELEAHLNVGMQVLEDAICNWQKSPGCFKHFRG
jgi:Alpha-glutamyl/putrescinyl thymine pyrophosphorylase clade 3